ncbi:MAG: hypothetical protein HKN08_03585 [Gammaproteobacteria bacterium]|nr:hypothetical protein [Gammaproteobacteria bacterium]
MEEKRKLKRFSVKLKVYNQDSGKLIGYIEDINIHGMNVKSTDRFPEMEEIKVLFGADDGANTDKIHVTVIKVWDAFTDTLPRLYNTGLHFISPTEQSLDKIQDMIVDLKGEFVTQLDESHHI